jgi:hypothetical protein
MPKRQITFDEVLNYINTLPYNKFKEVVEHYSKSTNANFETELEKMISLNFQQRLENLGINKICRSTKIKIACNLQGMQIN